MANDNDRFSREKKLAREYEKKMAARFWESKRKSKEQLEPFQIGPYEPKNFSTLFGRLFVPAFSQGKYQKPSAFFQAEMPWIYEYIIYDRFRDAFHNAVDRVTEYPYSIGWGRRSFRSGNFLHYGERIANIVSHFEDSHCLDADICDVLTGNLPEDALCYLKTRNTRTAGFCSEVLAYELDRDNPRLEEIVTDIVNGDSAFSTVSHELIRGIVQSRNPRMHQLLCRLLVAARLQEGLRQVICENADWGTMEAFHAILSTIAEHDLIRYSSVKRAVGTWIGVISYETRDMDRISNKSVELICKCLMDRDYRAKCLESEDSMAIHIALWSDAFEDVQTGYQTLGRIIEQGTHHQVLTAGYFVSNLENPLLRQIAARNALTSRREHYDILAVYLPSLIPYANYSATNITNGTEDPNLKQYFDSKEQALEMCDWLMEVHGSMKGKELVFDPCIFPWYAASVRKSDLMEKAMVIAAMTEDQERIEKLCARLTDCASDDRQMYFSLLTRGEKTPVIRKTIIDCLEDKSFPTRRVAFEAAKGLALTPEEYRRVEDMLRLRYDDLRQNAMELLMKQSDDALQTSIRRLLASSKATMRTAGLDLMTQLRKSEDRGAVADACMETVYAISKPTSQEKILIDALIPKQAEKKAELLFTEEDRYSASLLSLATGRRIIAGTPLAFGEGDPKGRIRNLAKWKKPAVWVLVLAIILCMVVGVCLLTDRSIRQEQHVGVTFYFGNVTEQTDGVIYVMCHDGNQRTFHYEAGNEDIPGDLHGKQVRIRARQQDVTGNLVATNAKEVPDNRFDALDEAIQTVILAHHSGGWDPEVLDCASFYTFASEGSAHAGSSQVEMVREYGIVYHQSYRLEDGQLVEDGGCNVPTVLTFRVDGDGSYILAEYWEPRDGTDYPEDIRAKYPPLIWPDTQKNMFEQKISIFRQVMEGFHVGPDVVVDHLINDVCDRERWAGSFDDLMVMCELQRQLLGYYGEETLDYCFDRFENGGENGTRGRVMAQVCSEILGDATWSADASGQAWFDANIADHPR